MASSTTTTTTITESSTQKSDSSSVVTSKKPHIHRISLSPLTPNNLGTVRKLNAVLFPIRYSENFYKEIVAAEGEEYCKLAYFKDIPVGVICCRVEKNAETPSEARIYCMTMGVLAAYRHLKIGSESLRHVLAWAQASNKLNSKPTAAKPRFTHMYLHVQVSNEGARKFYEYHGFKEVRIHEGYYKKIEPRDAWVLELDLSQYQP